MRVITFNCSGGISIMCGGVCNRLLSSQISKKDFGNGGARGASLGQEDIYIINSYRSIKLQPTQPIRLVI